MTNEGAGKMTNEGAHICSGCGQPIRSGPNERAVGEPATAEEAREYDHRGILMPRRTRVGGIITPQ